MKHSLFLKALSCTNTSGPPVWMMRQAGRHLATYREIRKKHSFLDMCHDPQLIKKVTYLPLDAYDVDAAILFSDILVVPEAMGLKLRFEDKIGPIFDHPITSEKDIQNLLNEEFCEKKLDFVSEGIKYLQKDLVVPLIGFCGAPFTLASYMIEGQSSRDLKKTKQWMFNDPKSFHALLDKITNWSIAYLKLQIKAGVNALQIFDSWANFLAHHQFREFSFNYLQKILEGLKDYSTPIILFCRGSSVFAPQLAELSPGGISLDWNCHLKRMREQIPSNIALQGNLDPDVLYAPTEVIEYEVNRLLDEMEGDQGFIFNLGHGISPSVSENAVRTLVKCVKRRSECHAISLS